MQSKLCLLLRQKRLCFLKLRPLAIRVLREYIELLVISFGFSRIACQCCGLCCAIKTAKTIRIVFLGGFELMNSLGWSIHFEQHLTE